MIVFTLNKYDLDHDMSIIKVGYHADYYIY